MIFCNIFHNIYEIIGTILILVPANNLMNQFNVAYEQIYYKMKNQSHVSC